MKKIKDETQIKDEFGWLERATKLIDKYGLFRVISGIFVLALFGLTLGLFINQKSIITKVMQEQKVVDNKIHSNKMQLRLTQINPQIDAIILKLLIETGSDRVFILEMHNGSNNPTGLPFVYGEITYEQMIDPNMAPIAEEYGAINLSRYSFIGYVYKHKLFKGTIDDLRAIDNKLAGRMSQNEVKYIYMMSLTGSNIPIGFVGVTYINKPINKNIEGKIMDASQKISVLLDLYNSTK